MKSVMTAHMDSEVALKTVKTSTRGGTVQHLLAKNQSAMKSVGMEFELDKRHAMTETWHQEMGVIIYASILKRTSHVCQNEIMRTQPLQKNFKVTILIHFARKFQKRFKV